MKSTLLRALLFWIVLIIFVQPLLSYKDYLIDVVVKGNAAYLAEKAAPLGGVTPTLKQEVLDNLAAIGFSSSDITIEYDTQLKDRQEQINVVIKVRRPGLFLYNFSSLAGPQYYYARHTVMSEYLP